MLSWTDDKRHQLQHSLIQTHTTQNTPQHTQYTTHNTQHNTTQHNTTQHNTAQHNTTQHNTISNKQQTNKQPEKHYVEFAHFPLLLHFEIAHFPLFVHLETAHFPLLLVQSDDAVNIHSSGAVSYVSSAVSWAAFLLKVMLASLELETLLAWLWGTVGRLWGVAPALGDSCQWACSEDTVSGVLRDQGVLGVCGERWRRERARGGRLVEVQVIEDDSWLWTVQQRFVEQDLEAPRVGV